MRRLSRRALSLVAIGVLSLGLTLVITQPAGTTGRLEAGQVAQQTYKAPRTVTYKSDLKTREAEDKAAAEVPPTYRTDLTATSQQDSKLNAATAAIADVRASPAPPEEKQARLEQLLANITPAQAQGMLALDPAQFAQTITATRTALARLQAGQVKQDDLARAEELVAGAVGAQPEPIRTNAILLGQKLLIPNYLIDNEATEAARGRVKSTVQPVSYTVERDQVIIYRGQVINEFDAERLAATGLTRPAFDWQKSLGIFLLTALFSVLLLLIGPRYAKSAGHPRRLLTLVTVFALAITISGVLLVPSQPIMAYVLPVSAAPLLVAIFYGFTYAVIAGICFVAFFALAAGGSFELFFIHLASTVAALLLVRRISDIAGFLRVGAVVTGVTFVGMTAFSLLAANFDPTNLPKFLLAAALQGALTSTFVFAGTAFLAGPLGILTFIQLLELENPRHPLLRRLATEAPGTYSHSLRIAGWVEDLAEKVGADPLLARVQALYHDIGKVNLAEYFVENQREGANPHAKLSPKESAQVLRAHISEGLTLAQEARLPEAVSAAVPEHHGTTMMVFFWEAAKRQYKAPRQAEYRYIGPKPRSKETAILMLADAVEAASRSIDNPDERKIQVLIHNLFTARIDDGQLDEAPLSTREMTLLKAAFTERIMTDLHKRVKYPGRTRG